MRKNHLVLAILVMIGAMLACNLPARKVQASRTLMRF